ncbi:hypothetical protein HN51_037786 [Arachis hypogaea]|nr:CLAVATA3/ESR (CLE)-related protein [Arachis hypogaea]
MKRSLSSSSSDLGIIFTTNCFFMLHAIIFLFLFVSSANCRLQSTTPLVPSSSPPPITSSRNNLFHHPSSYCDSFSRKSRSLCMELQRKQQQSFPPHNGLDPFIYGSEKRRVPSGPNPLHN